MKGVSHSCSEGGWWQRCLSEVHRPAGVGPNDGGHWHTPQWGRMPVINTTWWGVWVPSDVHQNGICFFPSFNRWEECETNWAKLQGHLLINQAEKRGEHIRSCSLGMWGQRHGVLIGEGNRYLWIIGRAWKLDRHEIFKGAMAVAPAHAQKAQEKQTGNNFKCQIVLWTIWHLKLDNTGVHLREWWDSFPPECYLPFPILLTHKTFSTYSRSMPCRFLYLSATMTGISRRECCFAWRECVCEGFAHGVISQWAPLKDQSCEAIISFLCSVEPPGKVGSGHLIQSFSSTVVHCTIHQHKSHLPCRRRWK